MPTYEFICRACETVFDISIDFATSLSLNPRCPNCKSKYVSKKWFAPGLIYKGNGFYSTDNVTHKEDK